AIVDNNVYTNLMAQANLLEAAAAARRHPKRAAELGIKSKEIKAWRAAAEAMVVPYDEALGVHPQSEGFTRHELWDFAATRKDQYPLLLNFHYFDIYRRQVVKQADLVLALYLRGEAFTAEEKARNFAYYEALTVRDSSLSASTQAVVAAEVGHLELAYRYLGEAAFVDLHDLKHNARDGLHMAAMAGAWQAVVAGFGGMRDYGGVLSFAPRLPAPLTRIAFRITFKGRLIQVSVNHKQVAYTLLQGEPLEIKHGDQTVSLESEASVECALLPILTPEPTHQPVGCEPYDRTPQEVEIAAPA
ncbi:MAG: glycosyl hydrolase family 65 protein, partial [Candidatus Dormibacteraceae bacterium]